MRQFTLLLLLIVVLVACDSEQPTATPLIVPSVTATPTVTEAAATPATLTPTPIPTDMPEPYPVPVTATYEPYPPPATATPDAYPYPVATPFGEVPSFEVFVPSHWLYFPFIDTGPPCPSKHGLAWGLRYEMRHVPYELCVGQVHYWSPHPIGHYSDDYIPNIWCKYPTPEQEQCLGCSTLAAAVHWLGADYDGPLYVGNEPDVEGQCASRLAEIGGDPNVVFARFLRDVELALPQAAIFASHTNATHFDEPSDFNGYSTVGMLEAYRSLYGAYPDIAGLGAHYEISGRSVIDSLDYISEQLDGLGLDYQLAWSEFQVCSTGQRGYNKVIALLDYFDAHERIAYWQYYTNHRTLMSTANCTLYDWIDDEYMGEYVINARGLAYRDWGLAHRGE